MHYRRVARIVLFSTRWPHAASRAARACTVNAWRKPISESTIMARMVTLGLVVLATSRLRKS